MNTVTVDFERLLGYKLIVRAKRVVEQHESASGESSESGMMDNCAAVLRAKIGSKPVFGLRYRGV